MSFAALATVLALIAPPTPERCAVIEIVAVGRSAHGATPLLDSAAHRLIRALDRLPAWTASAESAQRYRIVALRAASAVNIISPRATARIEVDLRGTDPFLPALRSALGPDVETSLSADACSASTGGNAIHR